MDKIITFMSTKGIWIISFILAFTTPIHAVMISVGMIIFIDMIFGIWASKVRGIKINSKRMSQSLTKMLAYQLLLVTSLIIKTHLITYLPLVEITSGFIGMIELLSISEKFTIITGLDFISYIKIYLYQKVKGGDRE